MRQVKLLGLMLVAVFAVTVAFSATAFALPSILPELVQEYTGKAPGTTLLQVLGGALEVECTGATGSGTTEKSTPLGSFHITFGGCKTKPLGLTCTTAGDNAGTILSLGIYHLVFDTLTPTLGVAILFLVSPNTTFVCGSVKEEVKGELLCLQPKFAEESKTHTFACVSKSSGEPSERTYWNAAGTKVELTAETELLTSVNGGTFTMSMQNGEGSIVTPTAVKDDA